MATQIVNQKETEMVLLRKELKYYQQTKNQLLKKYQGQFVLIKDEKLCGAFGTEKEAYEAGITRFGNKPFLIKQVIAQEDEVAYFPALTLGLLHADSQ